MPDPILTRELQAEIDGYHAVRSAAGIWHICETDTGLRVAQRRSDSSAADLIRRYREGFRVGERVARQAAERTLQEVLSA